MQWLMQANSILDGFNHATRSAFTSDALRPRIGLKVLAKTTGVTEKSINEKVHALGGLMQDWRTDALQKWIGEEKIGRSVASFAGQFLILASGNS